MFSEDKINEDKNKGGELMEKKFRDISNQGSVKNSLMKRNVYQALLGDKLRIDKKSRGYFIRSNGKKVVLITRIPPTLETEVKEVLRKIPEVQNRFEFKEISEVPSYNNKKIEEKYELNGFGIQAKNYGLDLIAITDDREFNLHAQKISKIIKDLQNAGLNVDIKPTCTTQECAGQFVERAVRIKILNKASNPLSQKDNDNL